MKVTEAKEQVLPLLLADAKFQGLENYIDTHSPDGDEGKIIIGGEPARVIHPRDGFYAKINLNWFKGSTEFPQVNKGYFFWYLFALGGGKKGISSYFLCDFKRLRSWALEFDAQSKDEHQSHSYWRGEIHILSEVENKGYFRWGDEPVGENKKTRFIQLRNIGEMPDILSYLPLTLGESKPSYDLDPSANQEDILDELQKFKQTYQNLTGTERKSVIQSRIGQGKFREGLITYWQGCAVTNCQDLIFLRASHIKPWRVSNNQERLDPFNGLLLLPNLDIAFDKGFIAFDNNGKIIISSKLDSQTREILRINSSLKLRKIDSLHFPYLKFHREHVFQK